MSRLNRAARRDANESLIVAALQACGARVQRLDGRGVPDLLVRHHGVVFLLEVKEPHGKLTPDQVEWWKEWGIEPEVVTTVDEALHAVGALGRFIGSVRQ